MHVWFLAVTTFVGFLARLTNTGYLLYFLFGVFIFILIFDLYIGLKIAWIGKSPPPKLIQLTWIYSWVQLGMFLLGTDAGCCSPQVTPYSALHWLQLWPGQQPKFLEAISSQLQVVSWVLLAIQIKLMFELLKLVAKDESIKKRARANLQT